MIRNRFFFILALRGTDDWGRLVLSSVRENTRRPVRRQGLLDHEGLREPFGGTNFRDSHTYLVPCASSTIDLDFGGKNSISPRKAAGKRRQFNPLNHIVLVSHSNKIPEGRGDRQKSRHQEL